MAVLLTAQFMSLVSISILNVALPSIQTDLGATASDMQWVLSGYALAFGVVLVAAGRVGDIFGHSALFLVGVTLFLIASVVAGFVQDSFGLNLARIFQGIGSGLINPQVMGIIQQNFSGQERGRVYGLLGTVAGASVAVGPLLGGALIEFMGAGLGWRSTFWINLPVGLGIIVFGFLWLPKRSSNKTADRGRNGRASLRSLDPLGALLLGVGVFALLLPFVQGRDHLLIWTLLPVGLVTIGLWIQLEKKLLVNGQTPMVNLDLFKIRSFSNGNIIGGLYYLGTTSVWVLVAIYAQQAHGFSALQAGMLGLPSAICAALGALWSGKRVEQYGRKIVIVGTIFAILGLALSVGIICLSRNGILSIWWLLLTLALMGLAQGSVISPNQSLTMKNVPAEVAGSAGGLVQTFQRIGTAVGIAVITSVFYLALPSLGWDYAMAIAFGTIGVIVMLTMAVAVFDQRRRNISHGVNCGADGN